MVHILNCQEDLSHEILYRRGEIPTHREVSVVLRVVVGVLNHEPRTLDQAAMADG